MPSTLLVPLETARLRLEPIRRGHAAALYEALADRSLYAYETETPPRDLAALRQRYAR